MKTCQLILTKYNLYPVRKIRVPSRSENGEFHIVEIYQNGEMKCDCPFSVFKKKDCRHIQLVKNYVIRQSKGL